MGVAISGWPLARAVARAGQLGVVSGTALEIVCARRLQRDGLVGINYLRKIEFAIPFACYGAMLAGVDHVIMGAGNLADPPAARPARPA